EIESAYESSDAFKRSGGKKLLVTSGLRNPKSETGNSYKTSKHNDGRAFDLRVNKEFYKWALNTEEGLEIMSKYNFRPLDETDPTTKEKTGATGDHIHFDNDERYNDWIKQRYTNFLMAKENNTPFPLKTLAVDFIDRGMYDGGQ